MKGPLRRGAGQRFLNRGRRKHPQPEARRVVRGPNIRARLPLAALGDSSRQRGENDAAGSSEEE